MAETYPDLDLRESHDLTFFGFEFAKATAREEPSFRGWAGRLPWWEMVGEGEDGRMEREDGRIW